MIKSLKTLVAAAVIACATPAFALPLETINGYVDFTGLGQLQLDQPLSNTNDPSLPQPTAILGFTGTGYIVEGTGDYDSADGTSTVLFSGFTFAPALSPNPAPLWSFSKDGFDYSFEMTSVSVDTLTGTDLSLSGAGFAYIHVAGTDDLAYAPTPGTWTLTGGSTQGKAKFGFQSTASVPDGGTTAVLLGFSLLGVGMISRFGRSLIA